MNPFHALSVPLSGKNLVEASAGTGKTHAMTTLVLRLLLEEGLPLESILVVTFTEAATAELRDRIRRRIQRGMLLFEGQTQEGLAPDPEMDQLYDRSPDLERDRGRLQSALRHMDEAAILTIHGFCHRLLRETAFEAGMAFDGELMPDMRPLRDQILEDFWACETFSAHTDVLASIAKWTPSACRPLADLILRHPSVVVLPESSGAASAPSAAALSRALAETRLAYDERVATVLQSAKLDSPKYQRRHFDGWLAKLPEVLAGDTLDAKGAEALMRWAADRLRDACKQGPPPAHPFFDKCQELSCLYTQFAEAKTAHQVHYRRRLVDYLRRELPLRKGVSNLLSFDDLLLHVARAVSGDEGKRLAETIAARYPAALIDEFQDTDPMQYAIFESVYERRGLCLFLIGDPKQAIYSFRGADLFAYLKAKGGAGDTRKFTMGTNWRSDPAILRGIEEIFSAPNAFAIDGVDFVRVSAKEGARDQMGTVRAPIEVVLVAEKQASGGNGGGKRDATKPMSKSEARECVARAVAADVVSLLASGALIHGRRISAGDVAVLTRTNKQAFDVQAALRRSMVPSVVLGDRSVFEYPEAEELQRVLSAVLEPSDGGLLKSALCTELLGLSANEVSALEEEPSSLDLHIARFRRLHEIWSERGFVQMFRALFDEPDVLGRLLSRPDGERLVTNLQHLMELLQIQARTLHLGPVGLLQWLARARATDSASPEDTQVRLESDCDAVRLTTIHKSKGLEYPVVYCPYLWDAREGTGRSAEAVFHDPDDDFQAKLDLGEDPLVLKERQALAEREVSAEDIRLLYVALTRAKHHLVIFFGDFRNWQSSALGKLLLAGHDPRALRDVSARRAWQDVASRVPTVIAVRSPEGQAMRTSDVGREAARVREVLPLRRRTLDRPLIRSYRTSSFSQLSRGWSVTQKRWDLSPRGASDEGDQQGDEAEMGTGIVLAEFPRGAAAGNLYHDILEVLDFAAGAEVTSSAVERRLAQHGEAPPSWRDVLVRSIQDVLATPMCEDPVLRLRDVTVDQRLSELEFFFPVGGTKGVLTPRELARVFLEDPEPSMRAYGRHVRGLEFADLRGFLKGYIDLVFSAGGKYYLADYKTNHLGNDLPSYACQRLPEAMSKGHYYLQYHLYTVALHRYLQQRVPSYRYEDHFGGVFYLFVKGMVPRLGPASGIFFDKPPLSRIERLERWLGGGEGAKAFP